MTPPKQPMTINEAIDLIDNITDKWMKYKKNLN